MCDDSLDKALSLLRHNNFPRNRPRTTLAHSIMDVDTSPRRAEAPQGCSADKAHGFRITAVTVCREALFFTINLFRERRADLLVRHIEPFREASEVHAS
jgi:hypothetical protein